ncbi:membrane-bound lytic murein transglycosylase D [Flavobacterium succinicans]|uniref:Membrane-bound lytic murein transglycosylase D n=2 Tax=Flavobacterium succinicans TaxID=29536 RepID=A0A1I4R8J9_9FLAO|nr:membrane-bound lytic murein transglycosylase D [Flavobacterium succinicans]
MVFFSSYQVFLQLSYVKHLEKSTLNIKSMSFKNTTLGFFFLFSLTVFSQQVEEVKTAPMIEKPVSYLDSIKQTFVSHSKTEVMDSLWMKELATSDIYNDLATDIQTLNTDVTIDQELPTALLKERLAALDAKSPFHIEYNQGLENLIKSFLKNRRHAFGKLMATSEYYFPIFEEALANKNIPLEIKYLAVVESALNPKAVSRVGATGLWQFMYHTGKQYNLKIDSYIDERSDPLKSSEAAAQYMANMYPLFQDWDLVLASYNSGPGNVTKAIRRSGGYHNFWKIKTHLPKETQGYVPAFLATMYLYEYHKEHGIVPQRAKLKHFETDTIRIQKEITFKQIADLIDVSISELQVLNPSYKMNVIPVYDNQAHYLRLPHSKIGLFTSNEEKIYAYTAYDNEKRKNPVQWNTPSAIAANTTTKEATTTINEWYKIKKGDNLNTVAADYKVSVANLKKWNNIKGNTVAMGKILKIKSTRPALNTPVFTTQQSLAENKTTKDDKSIDSLLVAENPTQHIVQKGDNLNTIATKYNISAEDLKKWNPITATSFTPGARINITNSNAVVAQVGVKPELKDITYVVQEGDNLGTIAKKFGTPTTDLISWNSIVKNKITAGKTLIVAKNEIAIVTNNATADSFKKREIYPSKPKGITNDYYVKKGDSLYSISKKYPGVTISDLEKWNGINASDLKPGMKLKING